jgi:hypothetical protein
MHQFYAKTGPVLERFPAKWGTGSLSKKTRQNKKSWSFRSDLLGTEALAATSPPHSVL